ncbi:MAG: 2,3-bisphosphoglycerate-independent phosphoglycerate mutase [Myxococcota bacterium]
MDFSLRPHARFAPIEGPVLTVVMDGVGIGARDESDSVWLARTPTLDWLCANAASTELRAHGTAVGLPSDKDMGNSEVGHNAIGAGRVFDQGAKRVAEAIESGELFRGEVWQAQVARAREAKQPLHFIGLLSDGNVHSHADHLHAMLRRCHADNVAKVRLHILLDGRDVPETSCLIYVDALEALLNELNDAGRDYRIASGGGRMTTTMDRYEADWGMVERGWKVHVRGEGRGFPSARAAVETFREEEAGIIDQYLPDFVVVENGAPVGRIEDGAPVVFFNFRGDRAIEITRAFTDEAFDAFERGPRVDVLYAGMMQYDGDLQLPARFLVDPPNIDRTMGEYLAKNGVAQFACSETQKFGHVTYFWNGNRSGMFDESLEEYLEVPSDDVPFDQRPWMKAAEITEATLAAIAAGKARHLRINYANGDMVGHTGHSEATTLAVQCVDLMLARLLPAIERAKGAIVVTADHGNADQMFERDKKTGAYLKRADGSFKARTSHSLNAVPCHVWAPGRSLELAGIDSPGLANLAATTFQLLGFEAPEGYAPSLLR